MKHRYRSNAETQAWALNNHAADFTAYGSLISHQPRRNGRLGEPKGFKAHSFRAPPSPPEGFVDEKVPSGKMYYLNENFMDFRALDTRSRWQHFVDWLKRKLRKLN